jgi:hypothetical protein
MQSTTYLLNIKRKRDIIQILIDASEAELDGGNQRVAHDTWYWIEAGIAAMVTSRPRPC